MSPCHLVIPALATGGLLWLCHFPVAWGWLAWVALVPLLCLVRSEARPRRIYLCAWAGGLVFFWPALQWMRVADDRMYATWAALATYCALYFPVAVALVRRLDRRTPLPLVVTVPAVWTALELLRAHFGTGFAWYFLGHTQHDFLPAIQVADLAGAYAVTFLVAAVNALLFELLYRWRRFRVLFALPTEPVLPRRSALALHAAAVGLLLAGTLGYGVWRLGQNEFDIGPRIALVQGNLGQGVRNARTAPGPEAQDAAGVMMGHYRRLARLAAEQNPDLIVWPETSYPDEWIEVAESFPTERINPDWRRIGPNGEDLAALDRSAWQKQVLRRLNRALLDDVQDTGVPSLLGLNARVLESSDQARRYNSAVLVGGDGQFAGRYDKIHRVPFGEYVPFRESLPWMNRFAPYDFDYSVRAGEQMTRFALGGHRFGVLICYEDTDPYLARQYVRNGDEKADFLLNISNDGWFDGTSEHEEHLAICRFRAVECRRSVARAVNMGISAVIDPNGRVGAPWDGSYIDEGKMHVWHMRFRYNNRFSSSWQAFVEEPWYSRLIPFLNRTPPVEGPFPGLPTSQWHKFKKVQGVLIAYLPIDRRVSLYAQWGDWLPWSCWGLIGVGLVGGWVMSRRMAPCD